MGLETERGKRPVAVCRGMGRSQARGLWPCAEAQGGAREEAWCRVQRCGAGNLPKAPLQGPFWGWNSAVCVPGVRLLGLVLFSISQPGNSAVLACFPLPDWPWRCHGKLTPVRLQAGAILRRERQGPSDLGEVSHGCSPRRKRMTPAYANYQQLLYKIPTNKPAPRHPLGSPPPWGAFRAPPAHPSAVGSDVTPATWWRLHLRRLTFPEWVLRGMLCTPQWRGLTTP